MRVKANAKKKNDRFNEKSSQFNDLGIEKIEADEVSLTSFESLGLNKPILNTLKKQNFKEPTSIQKKTIPLILDGKDVIAGSATGSGKTLAFGAGIIQHAKSGNGIQGLILTPTRELAEQVARSLKLFSMNQRLRITAVYGGVSINPQINELRRADIVVGTPGRLLDHINRRTIKLNKLKTLVLDEADTMLDMGFIVDVEKIIKKCPEQRQTLLFSATITGAVNSLAKRHTSQAIKIFAKTSVDPQKLTQTYYKVSKRLKFSLLVHLLKQEEGELAMIFCNSRRNTDFVALNVNFSVIKAKAIHGGFPQAKRNQVIKHFNSKKVRVLVCTDVAARGLDIKGVSHVYNYDIPSYSKQYVHRVGRTARAGKEGKAINILSPNDREQFSKIVRDNSIKVAREQMPDIERVKMLSLAN